MMFCDSAKKIDIFNSQSWKEAVTGYICLLLSKNSSQRNVLGEKNPLKNYLQRKYW